MTHQKLKKVSGGETHAAVKMHGNGSRVKLIDVTVLAKPLQQETHVRICRNFFAAAGTRRLTLF